MITLIIARHGNTFAPGETPRRVGARTDLPLVKSGEVQAQALGSHLLAQNLVPGQIYSSQLQRTRQTALLASEAMGIDIPVTPEAGFNEIDYGPDENLPEDIVRNRLGEQVMQDWETKAILPEAWKPKVENIRTVWQEFAARPYLAPVTLVVTSNGIARFALHLTGEWERYCETENLKLSTGAYGILTKEPDNPFWTLAGWNIRP